MKRVAAITAITVAAAAVAAFQLPVLPGAGGTVCDLVAANAGVTTMPVGAALPPSGWTKYERPFADMLVQRALVDADGDGDLEILETHVGPRGDQSPVVGGSRDGYGDMPYYEEAEGVRWLSHGGAWHAVYFDDHRLRLAQRVVTLTPQGPQESCQFSASFLETIKPIFTTGPEAMACGALTGQSKAMVELERQPLTADDRRYLTTGPRAERWREFRDGLTQMTHIRSTLGPNTLPVKPVITVDIDSDGKPERLLTIERYGTTSCNATILDLLPSAGDAEPDPAKRALLMTMQGDSPPRPGEYDLPTACGLHNAFVTVDGRPYFYAHRIQGGVERWLSKVENGRQRMVCVGEYVSRHTVRSDIMKGGTQGERQ